MHKQTITVPTPPAATPIVTAAFYKFVPLADICAPRAALQSVCRACGVLGTILLAPEGINGTICGTQNAVQILFDYFARQPDFADIVPKFSFAKRHAFHRMKVRLKREIVAMGQPDIDPAATGTYVKPEDWNALIARRDTLVIDTRNHYETAIGSFEGAVNPATHAFREFPAWANNYLANLPPERKPKNIAMFCTGGIRCEKATAYLRAQGYDNVFHLEGGILKYLENVSANDSKWHGDCFVFDQRVSVREGLVQGDYDMCHACRMPIEDADKTHPAYEAGVSCAHCIDRHNDTARARFRERQKQIALSRARGGVHLGTSGVGTSGVGKSGADKSGADKREKSDG